MNRNIIGLALGLTLAVLAGRSQAQAPPARVQDLRRDTIGASQTATATPEMWLYEQERNRYEDPRQAVRRKAEQRASQRADRLAAMKWYGQSNSRPAVSATPFTDTYGAGWVSNSANPYQWRSGGSTLVVAKPGSGTY